ncbi:cell cycle checkpoint [Melanogaster broomeanus]|nr:cell cycle checkpoint [Melanogaster broomeanus]
MRFRATVENVPIFFRIIQAVEKLQKKCIIKFTENEMHIICNDDANEGGIQVWSEVKVDSIFTNYRIQSNADNKITALLSALRSSSSSASASSVAAAILPTHDADELVMKLAKKNDQAVLSFEMLGISRTGRKVRVAHDVRIDVMRPSEVDKLREPLCPDTDMSIEGLTSQRWQGYYSSASVAENAHYRGKTSSPRRRAPDENATQPEASEIPDPEKMFSVHVSTRSFLKFLNSHVVSTTTIACICQNHCAILYVYIGDVAHAGGMLTFYIPTVIDDNN